MLLVQLLRPRVDGLHHLDTLEQGVLVLLLVAGVASHRLQKDTGRGQSRGRSSHRLQKDTGRGQSRGSRRPPPAEGLGEGPVSRGGDFTPPAEGHGEGSVSGGGDFTPPEKGEGRRGGISLEEGDSHRLQKGRGDGRGDQYRGRGSDGSRQEWTRCGQRYGDRTETVQTTVAAATQPRINDCLFPNGVASYPITLQL